MNMLMVTSVILGVFALIVLLCLGVIWLEKRFPSDEYDERQKQAKGNASRIGMITGMLYFIVVSAVLIRQVEEPKAVEPYLLVFVGILLMVTVDHTYCFLTHAALPLSQKPMTSIVCYALGGVAQFLYIWEALDRFPLSLVGRGSAGWIHLLTGIDFLYLSLMHLIQYLRDRKEPDGAEG